MIPDCEIKMDLVFVIDNSGSINQEIVTNYDLLKTFITLLIDRLDVGADKIRIGAVKFSYHVDIVFHMDRYTSGADMQAAIMAMEYEGESTNTAGALRVTREQLFVEARGDRRDVRNVAIVITDGNSNIDWQNTIHEANLTKQANIALYVVGALGNIVDVREMKVREIIILQ